MDYERVRSLLDICQRTVERFLGTPGVRKQTEIGSSPLWKPTREGTSFTWRRPDPDTQPPTSRPPLEPHE